MNKERRENQELVLMTELLREKLDTFRPSVHAKEAIYNRLVKGGGKARAKHWYAEVWLILRRASLTASVSFGVLLFGMTTGYAYFSPNVNSENPLFVLKKSVETVEYFLAFSNEDKIKKLVKFSRKREEEIDNLAGKGVKDVYAIKEIERNVAQANTSLEKVVDPKEKEFLYVMVNGKEVNVADFEEDLTEEPFDKDVEEIDDLEEEKDAPVKLPIGIVKPFVINELAPVPALEKTPVDTGGGFEKEFAPLLELGGGGDADYSLPLLTPKVEVQDSCFDLCETGEVQKCGDGGVQTCGNFDKDSCYEWSSCKVPDLPDGYSLDDFEWDL